MYGVALIENNNFGVLRRVVLLITVPKEVKMALNGLDRRAFDPRVRVCAIVVAVMVLIGIIAIGLYHILYSSDEIREGSTNMPKSMSNPSLIYTFKAEKS